MYVRLVKQSCERTVELFVLIGVFQAYPCLLVFSFLYMDVCGFKDVLCIFKLQMLWSCFLYYAILHLWYCPFSLSSTRTFSLFFHLFLSLSLIQFDKSSCFLLLTSLFFLTFFFFKVYIYIIVCHGWGSTNEQLENLSSSL